MEGNKNVYQFTSGPRDAEILLVGEAWGADEARARRPFVGASGLELNRMLADAGLDRNKILVSNLISAHPPGNDFTRFLNPGTAKGGTTTLKGVHITDPLAEGIKSLHALIQQVKPKLIIGCGNWPLWALTSHAKVSTQKGFRVPSGIMDWRGSQTFTEEIHGQSYPYLPIIHPAAILRDFSMRHTTCHDLRFRAARYLQAAKLSKDGRSFRRLWQPVDPPTLSSGRYAEAAQQLRTWLGRARGGDPLELCCDVETYKHRWLVVVGLSDGTTQLVVPFFYFDPEGRMIDVYSPAQESSICGLLRRLLTHPNVRVINQNYAYDYQFLSTYLGIFTHPSFDTMLGHHLLYPGTPKSLDYLASLYSPSYCFWKHESQGWDTKSSHHDMWKYNGKDTYYTWHIAQTLKHLIARANRQDHMNFQMRQWSLYCHVSQAGVKWDTKRSLEMRTDLIRIAEEIGNYLLDCMPENLKFSPSGKPWYDSNSHCQFIFYECLRIQPVLHKKTKKPTLDKESFETLKKRAPWLSPIFDLLKLLRSVNVFARNFLDVSLGSDGRMHSSFNVGGTDTYRLSSSSNAFDEGMNLQNLPKKEDD